tara:strand:- start:129 stop:368 length:240 start_codon:yes stop_codon:yes gene_type:complete
MTNKVSNIEIAKTLNSLTSITKFGIDGNQVIVWQGKCFSQFTYLSDKLALTLYNLLTGVKLDKKEAINTVDIIVHGMKD